jgi:Spy/CpxP family protein refolding chaperone
MKTRLLLFALLLAPVASGFAQEPEKTADPEAAYTRTITERADKIVATLAITNAAQSVQIRDLIAQQYRNLREIHDARDATIKAAKAKSSDDKAAADATVKTAQDEAKVKLDELHGRFLAGLSSHLTPEQVDKVKDGLTYGVVQVTYNAYLKMYPDLKEEEKVKIRGWLVEAREIAMDAGTSNEKHAVFGKYKGRINNYLSKAGYNPKEAEKNLLK